MSESPEKREANLTATKFPKNTSGNPGGRPRDLPRFRKACRKLSWEALEVIREGLNDPMVSFGDKVTAFKALTSKGGYLDVDRQAGIDTDNARLLVMAAALKDLSEPKRDQLLGLLADLKQPEKTGS